MQVKEPSLQGIRRKLERWELQHLREYITELHSRLQTAEQDAQNAWSSSDMWRDNCQCLTDELLAEGATVGITQGGVMSVLAEGGAA